MDFLTGFVVSFRKVWPWPPFSLWNFDHSLLKEQSTGWINQIIYEWKHDLIQKLSIVKIGFLQGSQEWVSACWGSNRMVPSSSLIETTIPPSSKLVLVVKKIQCYENFVSINLLLGGTSLLKPKDAEITFVNQWKSTLSFRASVRYSKTSRAQRKI